MDKVHSFFNTTDNYLHRSFGVRVRAEIVSEMIGRPKGKRILDLGCGNGGISLQFIENNKLTLLDLSENMIDLVKAGIDSTFKDNATLLVGSMFDVQLGGDYDHIFAIGLLAHVPSASDCLGEIFSMLKPGGSAVIQFSDYNSWVTRKNINNSGHYGYNINRLTYESMKGMVAQHNWIVEKEVRFSFTLPGMGRLPDGLLYNYSRLIWKSRLLSRLGTDYMWHLRKL